MLKPPLSPASPMRGPYLIRNPRWNVVFRTMDNVLGICRPGKAPALPPAPRRLLLANPAHLGDIIASTAVLSILKSAFPKVQVGMLVGSWSAPLVAGHPQVDRVHVFDHCLANRGNTSFFAKLRRHWTTRAAALAEIQAVGYDTALDLYSYFPNLIPLLWRAGIPIRIGYTSGGFGPLLTHPVPFVQSQKHESEYQAELFRVLPVPEEAFSTRWGMLPDPPEDAAGQAERFVSRSPICGGAYRVLHLGTGGSLLREWPFHQWRAMAERLVGEGHRLVFTGQGDRERTQIQTVIEGLPGCANACNELGWGAFVEVLRRAEVVYSVETSAGHLAASFGTPCVSLYSGMHDHHRWRPRGRFCRLLTRPLPCSPCFRRQGCEGMECIRLLEVDAVYQAGEELAALAHGAPRRTGTLG
ncbi:MAG: glycosyltransferase family 9 protein [Deltaproteobacteria bacterium]|nr:glycosyltransferase family 9 protein [Deltaproteobacteria bacterium]